MNRHVLTLDLRDDPAVVAAYREYHAKVWPDVVSEPSANAGVRSMDIYLLGRRLVMVLDLQDGLDLAHVFERHASSGATVGVEELMKSLQQPAPGARDGEWWARMEQVFVLPALIRHRVGPQAIRFGTP